MLGFRILQYHVNNANHTILAFDQGIPFVAEVTGVLRLSRSVNDRNGYSRHMYYLEVIMEMLVRKVGLHQFVLKLTSGHNCLISG